MNQKPIPETSVTPNSLARQIIADMKPGEERSDAGCPGLRVRCAGSRRVFFYRYRARGASYV
jgi:hypothetical protein